MSVRQTFIIIIFSSAITIFTILTLFFVFSPGIANFLDSKTPRLTELSETKQIVVTENEQIISTIERTNPAVVSVVVSKDIPIYEQYYESFDPWGFFGGFSIPKQREIGTEEKEIGGGSGFLVSDDGMIVTNRHVVSDADAHYSILLNDGTDYEVEILANDPQLDISILKIVNLPEEIELPYLEFGNSKDLRLGEAVIAIGNALAEFRNSISVGVVSGLARSITATDGRGLSENLDQIIQTDAAINPGNSGGPLLNLSGEVIGVNVATSRGADNIGFALPSHVVKQVVESVKEHGEIIRPFLGVRYTMITPRIQELNNLSVDYGALVVRGESRDELAVMPGSPADKADIVENDIILEIDDQKLKDTDLATILRTKNVGDTIKVSLLHKGKEVIKNIVLDKSL